MDAQHHCSGLDSQQRSGVPAERRGLLASLVRRVLGLSQPRSTDDARADARWAGAHPVQIRCRFHGRTLGMFVREGTGDERRARSVISNQGVMTLPDSLNPYVIADIGAGVGIHAVYLATLLPNAEIYCFEPDPSAIELLQQNTRRHSEFTRVVPVPARRVQRSLAASVYAWDEPATDHRCTPIQFVRSWLDRLRGGVDMLCIDAQGHELELLRSLDRGMLENVQAVIGWTHRERSSAVLQLLARTHVAQPQTTRDTGHPFVLIRRDLALPGAQTAAA